jgi:hypothetical protein
MFRHLSIDLIFATLNTGTAIDFTLAEFGLIHNLALYGFSMRFNPS